MDIGDKVFIEIGVRQYGRCKVLSRAWAAKKKESRRWKAHGKINNRHIAVRFPAAAIRVETHIFMPVQKARREYTEWEHCDWTDKTGQAEDLRSSVTSLRTFDC